VKPAAIPNAVRATVVAMRRSVKASTANDDIAIRAYERVLRPYVAAGMFRAWPATFESLHYFVTDFVTEPAQNNPARPTARGGARPYVSRIITHSRLAYKDGTITKEQQTDLNRWIKGLGGVLDQFRTRRAFPFTPAILQQLHRWFESRRDQSGSLSRLQTYTAVLVSCQLALRTHNVVDGLHFEDIVLTPDDRAAVVRLSRPKSKVSAAKEQIPLLATDVNTNALVWLKRYTFAQFGQTLQWMTSHRPKVPVFPQRQLRGQWVPWSASKMTARMRQACLDAGVPDIIVTRLSLRSGRHAFVSEATAQQCPPEVIQQFTGHQDVKSLPDYLHVPVVTQLGWQQRMFRPCAGSGTGSE